MDANIRDIKVLYGPLADLNYAHLCFFFVSLDQLLCNNQPIPSFSSFTTIRKGTDLFGIFLFTKLPLVKGHCQSLHLLSVLL